MMVYAKKEIISLFGVLLEFDQIDTTLCPYCNNCRVNVLFSKKGSFLEIFKK